MTTDWTDMLGAAGAGAARGAAIGSIVPGVGTAIGGVAGGLIGVAMNAVPGLQHLIAGNADTIAKAESVVRTVTGTDDPAQAQAAVDSDPGLAGSLRLQLAQIAADADAARLADVQDARATTVQLAQTGSTIAWGAPVISVIVMIAFFTLCTLLIMHAVPDGSTTLLNVLLGSLGVMASNVVSYWTGSSAGSASKDARLANSVPASLLPRPAAVVPAADVAR